MENTKAKHYGLQDILDEMGYDNFEELGEEYIMDCACPGICRNCGEIVDRIEHDCYNGWCSNCETQGVRSAFALMGII